MPLDQIGPEYSKNIPISCRRNSTRFRTGFWADRSTYIVQKRSIIFGQRSNRGIVWSIQLLNVRFFLAGMPHGGVNGFAMSSAAPLSYRRIQYKKQWLLAIHKRPQQTGIYAHENASGASKKFVPSIQFFPGSCGGYRKQLFCGWTAVLPLR